ncbi:MAG: S-methyl-5-thioribose-1-phosphate isomerase, partial [Clostridia bacterium]|nr:S-methyl-5-thioribose-1-phosphate isomerase [Clostridia bacterium]
MERQDKGLAFMLQYENVAWFDGREVRILDRRVYPGRVEFVTCKTHEEVARAIADMVTQSAGPYTAAAMGMALAAHECRDRSAEAQLEWLEAASQRISHARPTTVSRMKIITEGCLAAARRAIEAGGDAAQAVMDHTIEANNLRYSRVRSTAKYLVDMFPDNGAVMTQCFGETIVGMMLKECRERNKAIRLFCPETRPYFQGARLTATVCSDMGFDVTVITDNMPAAVMRSEKVDVFTSAADVICMDGHVVNKVGTFQIAICADRLGVPYYVTAIST